MTLVSSVVTAALRKIRVVDATTIPEPQQMTQGIDAMNRMVMRWQASGTELGYLPASMPDETLPAPIEAENAIIYNLALELGMEYGKAPTSDVVNYARAYLGEIVRDQFVSTPLRANRSGAPMPSSTWGSGYDVYTDGYR